MSRRIRDYCRWANENGLPANNLAVDIQIISIFSEIMERQRKRAHFQGMANDKAAKRAAEDPNAWMRPIFEDAWARLDADCPKRIGRRRLLVMAWRIAGPDHPDHYRRYEMTDRKARAYLASLKSLVDTPQQKKSGTCA